MTYYNRTSAHDIVIPLGESRWYGDYEKENQYYYYVTAGTVTISSDGVVSFLSRYISEWNDKASWTSAVNPTYSVYGINE